ncbi:MAG TPA: hypothetical protein VFG04_04215 [Planctomycetaceae bacterium]|jgi:hypothetical protein|nr:hypothetical protein [Planctomycetaceae bacterium]
MTDKPDRARWGRGASSWVVVLLAFYVASTGPACKFCFDYHHSPRPLLFVYRPIWELSRFSFPGKALSSYLRLWGSHWTAEYWDCDHGVIIK